MIFVVVPTYNNQERLPTFLAAVQVASTEWNESYRALVVDDGSTDDTAELVLDFGTYGNFELLHHDQHLGEGMALKTGLKAVLNAAEPGDTVVVMAMDHENIPALVKSMLPLLRDQTELVTASRFAPGGREEGLNRLQLLVRRLANRLTCLVLATSGLGDTLSRCQAYRVEVLQRLIDKYGDDFIQQSSYACWLEILIKMLKLDSLNWTEIPLVLRHDLPGQTPGVGQTLKQHLHLIGRNWRYR